MSDKPCKATPPDELLEQLLDCRVPKTEREHFAASKIEQLQAELVIVKQSEVEWSEIARSVVNNTNKNMRGVIEQLQAELAKAQPVLDAAINQAQYFSENGDSTVFQVLCGKTNTAVREYKEE